MAQTTGNEEWNSENPADNSVFHEGDRGTLHKRKSARSVREEDQTSFGAAELAPLTRQGSGGRELIGDGEAGVAAAAALGLTAEGGGGGGDDGGGEGAGQGEGEGGDAVGGLGGGAGGPRGVRTRDFDILCVIGMGAYGRVLQVRHKRNRKVYAMKVISKALLRKKNHISYMQAERDIMTKVDHPFVVGLKCSFQTPEKMFLIMDYMPGGELFFHLDREGFILEEVARFYVAELTLALEFLHSIHIIHRDLKPENVLIDAQGHIKVTDFGLAKDFRDGDASDEGTRTVCGTYEYMAPEMISKKGYSKAVDWWSLGTLMYEMMTGKPPFRGKNKDVLMKRILTEKIKFPPWLTGEATSLMKAFLERNVQRRLGATKSTMFKVGGTQAIKEHRFFAAVGLDWHAIEACRRPGPILPDLATGMDTSYFHEDFTQMEVPRSLSFESQASMGDLGPPDAACLDLYKGFSFIHPNWETEQQETHSYEPRVPNNPAPVPEEEAKLETSEEGPSSESEEEEEEAEEARATAPAQRQPGNMFAGFSGASSSEASTLPSRSASHRVTRGSSLDVDGTQFHMDELATGLAKTVINEEAPTPAESEAGAEEEGEKGAAARVAGAQQPSPAAAAAAAGAAAATTAAPAPAPAPPPAGRRLTATAAPFNPYAAAAAAAAAGAGGGGAGLPLPGYPAPPLPPGYYMTPQGAVVAAGTAPPPAPYGYYPHPHPAAAAYPGGLMMGGAPAFYPPGTAPPPPGGRPAHGGGGGGPPGKKAKNKKKKNKKQPPPQEQKNGHTNPSSPAPVPEATSSKQGADDDQPPSNQTNQSCTERPTPEKDSAPKHVAFAAEVLAKGESTETNRRSIKQGQQAASSQQSRAPVGWAATAARGGGPGAGFHPPHGGWGRGRGAFPPHHRAPNGGPAPPPPSGAPPPRGGAGPPAPPPKQEDFPSLGGNDFPALGGKPGGPAPLPRAPAPQAKSWRAVVKTADGAGGGVGVGVGAGAGSMAAGWGAGPPARKQLAAAPAVDAPPAPVAGDAGVLKGDANGWKPAGRAAAGAGGGSSAWQPPAKPW